VIMKHKLAAAKTEWIPIMVSIFITRNIKVRLICFNL
jgi:hypothetical protein